MPHVPVACLPLHSWPQTCFIFLHDGPSLSTTQRWPRGQREGIGTRGCWGLDGRAGRRRPRQAWAEVRGRDLGSRAHVQRAVKPALATRGPRCPALGACVVLAQGSEQGCGQRCPGPPLDKPPAPTRPRQVCRQWARGLLLPDEAGGPHIPCASPRAGRGRWARHPPVHLPVSESVFALRGRGNIVTPEQGAGPVCARVCMCACVYACVHSIT